LVKGDKGAIVGCIEGLGEVEDFGFGFSDG
jgi:hypothetical protein